MKTALVTGANRGIGLEFCKQLKSRGYKVIGLCRTPSPELEKTADQILDNADVTERNVKRD